MKTIHLLETAVISVAQTTDGPVLTLPLSQIEGFDLPALLAVPESPPMADLATERPGGTVESLEPAVTMDASDPASFDRALAKLKEVLETDPTGSQHSFPDGLDAETGVSLAQVGDRTYLLRLCGDHTIRIRHAELAALLHILTGETAVEHALADAVSEAWSSGRVAELDETIDQASADILAVQARRGKSIIGQIARDLLREEPPQSHPIKPGPGPTVEWNPDLVSNNDAALKYDGTESKEDS